MAIHQTVNTILINIIAYGGELGREESRQRQTDITQSDNTDPYFIYFQHILIPLYSRHSCHNRSHSDNHSDDSRSGCQRQWCR